MTYAEILTSEFRALSARLGQDPLQVQGPGGNTSIKQDGVMWIKASGTELADAVTTDIFVAVDRDAALAEAFGRSGDGSCKATVLDTSHGLRPSIETTFHAALDWPVVCHTHSVATLTHAIGPEGLRVLGDKLKDLPYVTVPYAKPGLPLTSEILARVQPETQVIILQNHGLICCGATVQETDALITEVERRLALPISRVTCQSVEAAPPDGFVVAEESWMALDAATSDVVLKGSYYPDHVVFLGHALPESDGPNAPPVLFHKGQGIWVRQSATGAQRAMLRCLSDILSRLPSDWSTDPIGEAAEAELLNWDAEKYRQALAEQQQC